MFQTVKVLVAIRDDKAWGELAMRVSGLGFDVSTTGDGRTVLDIIADFDCLLLDADLENGNAKVILDRWVASFRKPCLVVMKEIVEADRVTFLTAGAWNIVRTSDSLEIVSCILVRYGVYILEMRELAKLEAQVKKLIRLVTVFALLAAALAGERVIDLIRMGLGFIK